MTIAVCGGRDFADWRCLCAVLDAFAESIGGPVTLVEGGARGADRMARRWANERGYPVKTFEADWTEHGRAAGPIRNGHMIKEGQPDVVISFLGGAGTANMVKQSQKAGVPVFEVHVKT